MAAAGAGTQKTTVACEKGRVCVVNFKVAIQVDSKSFAHMIPFLVV